MAKLPKNLSLEPPSLLSPTQESSMEDVATALMAAPSNQLHLAQSIVDLEAQLLQGEIELLKNLF